MAGFRTTRPFRAADYYDRLRLSAVATVIAGVVLLAVAAFLLSYGAIHQIALNAGVSAGLARLYPLIFDAMLVVACVAALALREAEWWMRVYAWLSILVLLTGIAIADALHAAGVTLPRRPTAAAIATAPWVLLLVGFGLWLLMLRYLRNWASNVADDRRAGPAGPAVASGHQFTDDRTSSGGFPFWETEPDTDDTPDARIIHTALEPDRPNGDLDRPHAEPDKPCTQPEEPYAEPDTDDTPSVRIIPAQRQPDAPETGPGSPG